MNGTDTEWQQRTELLLGEDKMLRLRNSHVLVVGLGGVGEIGRASCRERVSSPV